MSVSGKLISGLLKVPNPELEYLKETFHVGANNEASFATQNSLLSLSFDTCKKEHDT